MMLWLINLTLLQTTFSQNVGIGTPIPMARLDINGDIATHSADIIITNTYNTALDVNTQKQRNYKILQSVPVIGNFVISGITSGVDGRTITLANRSGYPFQFINEDGNTIAANRIRLGVNGTLAIFNGGAATLKYDAVSQRWEVISSLDYFGGVGNSFWNSSGTDISNSNPGNVGIGGAAVFGYKLYVRGRGSFENTGLTGPASGGAMEIASTDVTGQQSIKIDGQKIQSTRSSSIITPSTAKNLLLNPFGGNVGVAYNNPSATFDVGRGTATGGTAAFRGAEHVTHINFSTTEETYIRGGKTGSAVYINDSHNGDVNIGNGGGTVNIGTTTGTTNIGGTGPVNVGATGRVNVGSGGLYSAQTGGLNMVPLGIFQYSYRSVGSSSPYTISGNVSNIVGNLKSSSSYSTPGGNVFALHLHYNPTLISGYSKIITIGSESHFFFDGYIAFGVYDTPRCYPRR